LSEQSGNRNPRRLSEAEREAREKRRRRKRIKKYLKFFGAWAALAAVIVLIIVLIASCVKSSSAKNRERRGAAKTAQSEQGSMESQGTDRKESEETPSDPASETGTQPQTETHPASAVWNGETAEELIESGKAKKVVFLTFDDGPSPNTSRLLDILKKYDVKVTFFVVGWEENLMDTLKRESQEGHTVAVHSFTHNYSYIYTDDSVFWDDNAQMRDIITEQTGIVPDLMRFPGGASNHVSADYNSGIMTRLTGSVEDHGYDFVDWNVSSGDGGATAETSQIYQNVIDGIEKMDISVVLMHDSHDYTVDAVEDIIKYCLDRGYTLLPLHKGIFTCHHGVWN